MKKYVAIDSYSIDTIIDKIEELNNINLQFYIIYKHLPLVGNLSVLENIALLLSYHKGIKIRSVIEQITKELTVFGLENKLHHRRDSLSELEILFVKYITAKVYGVKEIIFILPIDHAGVGMEHELISFLKSCNENYTILDYNETYYKYHHIEDLIRMEIDEWLTQDLKG